MSQTVLEYFEELDNAPVVEEEQEQVPSEVSLQLMYADIQQQLIEWDVPLLPDITEFTVDGERLRHEQFTIYRWSTNLYVETVRQRDFRCRTPDDYRQALDVAHKDYRREQVYEEEKAKMRALQSMRPTMTPGLNGHYGELLVEFKDSMHPVVCFSVASYGNLVQVEVSSILALLQLTQPKFLVRYASRPYYMGAYSDVLSEGLYKFQLANSMSYKASSAVLDEGQMAALRGAIERYAEFNGRLGCWKQNVEDAGLSYRDVENYEDF